MKIELRTNAFDPYKEIAVYEETLDLKGRVGATASFVGTMRDFNEDASIQGMWLEYYPGMTEKQLKRLEVEARKRWPLEDVLIVHRYGNLVPGDRIVLVITASPHRDAALESCQFLIDWLKTKAPFWKLENMVSGKRWVESREEDTAAANRWAPIDEC